MSTTLIAPAPPPRVLGPFKECPCCARCYTSRSWLRLPLVGYMLGEDVETALELRNCVCHSTIAVSMTVDRAFDAVNKIIRAQRRDGLPLAALLRA